MTPEEQNARRANDTAEFMADFDKTTQARLQHLIGQCASRTGLPSRLTLDSTDPRLNKFCMFVLQELAVVQVFQGKTFGRLLDILGQMPDAAMLDMMMALAHNLALTVTKSNSCDETISEHVGSAAESAGCEASDETGGTRQDGPPHRTGDGGDSEAVGPSAG